MDGAGNLTTWDDFNETISFRLVSYIDPDVCIGLDPNTGHACVRRRSLADDTYTLFSVYQITENGFVMHSTFDPNRSLIVGPQGPMVYVVGVLPDLAARSQVRIDWVRDAPWFALNTLDGGLVADIGSSNIANGSPILWWPWNGGDNQVWRADSSD